jgi:YHS domain-containing protein
MEDEMTAVDPVCGMEVEVQDAEWKSEYNGQTYYFCAPGCKRSFDADPEKYLQGNAQAHQGHSH